MGSLWFQKKDKGVECLRKDDRDTNALRVRASIRIIRGQLDLAITDLQQALNDQPRSTEFKLALQLGKMPKRPNS